MMSPMSRPARSAGPPGAERGDEQAALLAGGAAPAPAASGSGTGLRADAEPGPGDAAVASKASTTRETVDAGTTMP